MKTRNHLLGLLFAALFLIPITSEAQRRKKSSPAKTAFAEDLYSSMEYRSIGPHRGGRSAAVTGVPGEPNLFYFGATGGGVWKTLDGGRSWENISDGYFGGSIGAVEVSKSDPNVRMFSVGSQWLTGLPYRTAAQIASSYEAVTLAQVNDALAKWSLDSNMTVVVGPCEDLTAAV